MPFQALLPILKVWACKYNTFLFSDKTELKKSLILLRVSIFFDLDEKNGTLQKNLFLLFSSRFVCPNEKDWTWVSDKVILIRIIQPA